MTTHEEAIREILTSAPKLTLKRNQLGSILSSSGIIVDDYFTLVSLKGNAETCVKSLMANLSPLPVVKISANHILGNLGITV